MRTSMRPSAAADGTRTPARRLGRLAGLAGLAGVVVALGAGAPAAQADTWGYEQVSPADGGTYGLWGAGVSRDGSTPFVVTTQEPIDGQPADGRAFNYYYGLAETPGGWTPFQTGPVSEALFGSNPSTFGLAAVSADGSESLFDSAFPWMGEATVAFKDWWYRSPRTAPNDLVGLTPDPVRTPNLTEASKWAASPDLGTFVYWEDATGSTTIRDSSGGVVNLDNEGDPMPATMLAGGRKGNFGGTWGYGAYMTNAVSADGSKVVFASSTALDGDTDTAQDLYQRDRVAGTTTLISDDTPGADADENVEADFRWASATQSRVIWSTTEQHDGDADGAADLFYRDGDGSIARISAGETVGGSPTGNAEIPARWVATSEDGNRVAFITTERLTEAAPAEDTTEKLYERDIAEGVTRFVAGPLAASDVAAGRAFGTLLSDEFAASYRPIRLTPWGMVFESAAPLVGDADGDVDIFAWTRGGGLQLLSTPAGGAPPSSAADSTLLPISPELGIISEAGFLSGGRGAGGSRAFFTTAESLTAEDTDSGKLDVYAWSTDGSLELVSPSGDAQTDATYLGNSPDGSRVFFQTAETVLPGDIDGGVNDVYLAVLNGGSAPSKPVAPVPAGPAGAAGPLPQVPSTPTPPSGTPKPVEPAPVAPPIEPVRPAGEGGDDGDRTKRARLKARVGKRLGADGAKLVARASAAGELRIRAVARVRRGGELRKARVAKATEELAARERTRFDIALSDAAMERLERRGRLRVRFVVRLRPSGEQRGAKERVTVTLRSGQRR